MWSLSAQACVYMCVCLSPVSCTNLLWAFLLLCLPLKRVCACVADGLPSSHLVVVVLPCLAVLPETLLVVGEDRGDSLLEAYTLVLPGAFELGNVCSLWPQTACRQSQAAMHELDACAFVFPTHHLFVYTCIQSREEGRADDCRRIRQATFLRVP